MPSTGAGVRVRGKLPPELTSFVGRRDDLAAVGRLLADGRLVTLTGPGGAGKTRLALQAAAKTRRAFPDGVWYVDLTEVGTPGPAVADQHDPDGLACLVTATLGLQDRRGAPPLRQLTERLADRRILLVLDNCEHVLAACGALVHGLLVACPQLRILATSREQLAVPGELILPVPPLPVPDRPERPGAADMGTYESVALFVARARAVEPGFDLTAGNREAVAEICHRLDGLPLAIELAAAGARVLSPQQILDRLAGRLPLPAGDGGARTARQRTLRSCADWSFALCSEPERRLWARLSVFAGRFELDAVEGICADELLPAESMLDVVAGLVHKSVIARDDDDADGDRARYRLLWPIRDLGHDQLARAGEEDEMRRRHRDWYRRLVDRAAAEWIGTRQGYWHARLTGEHPNVRAAVDYSLATPGEAGAALHIAVTVPRLYWWTGGLFGEGRRWLGRGLERFPEPTALRARALLLYGNMALAQNQPSVALPLLAEGEELARRLGAGAELALAAHVRATHLLYQGDSAGAARALDAARYIEARLPDRESGLVMELRLGSRIALGLAAGLTGDRQHADACIDEAMAATEELGELGYRVSALWARAMVAWHDGTVEQADAALVAGLRLRRAHRLPDRLGAERCMELVAWLAAGRREHRRAATLLGAADALRAEIGSSSLPAFAQMDRHHETCEERVRSALGDAGFDAAFAAGRAMPHDDALAYALDDHPPSATPTPAGPSALTRREREVADLVAEGLSNRDIAAKLLVSQRTAESHVEHILAKLGCRSRTQVAAWAAANRR